MDNARQANYFLLSCVIASLVTVYFIVAPFLIPLILAAVFAFLFQPMYRQLLHFTHGQAVLSALAATLLAILVIVLPLALVGTLLLRESAALYHTLSDSQGGLIGTIEGAVEAVRAKIPFDLPQLSEINFGEYARQAAGFLIQNLGALFSSFALFLLSLFVFLVSFYFLLKDGVRLKNYFVALSPLPDENDELIVSRLSSAVNAVVKGSLTIALIQSVLTGIGLAVFGVPHAALWGSVAAVAALVPGAGTSLVIIPSVLYLFLTGSTAAAIGLAVWGIAAVGLIDNFLGPKIVGRGMQLHPLAVLLSALGGIALFGPLGFLLGPLAMSLCIAFIDIYFSLRTKGSPTASEQ